jgi:hypothetical protein
VRYPYPAHAISAYKKEFPKKSIDMYRDHKEAWNLEKETKYDNKHKLDDMTTTKEVFKGTKGQPAKSMKVQKVVEPAPIQKTSHY